MDKFSESFSVFEYKKIFYVADVKWNGFFYKEDGEEKFLIKKMLFYIIFPPQLLLVRKTIATA